MRQPSRNLERKLPFAFEGRDGEGCSSFEGSRSRDWSQLEQSERMEKGNGFRSIEMDWTNRVTFV
ncbi:MAG: hypothetical protein ACTS47_01295 [Candidatus Hodgkinia cicadicola]